MSTRDDIISIKNGLITLGNAIDNLSVHGEDSEQIVKSAKTINFKGKDHNSIYGKGLQWSGMGNTKTRKLGHYVARTLDPRGLNRPGTGLMIQGTSVKGFDEDKSIQKTLRKPEEQLKEFSDSGPKKVLEFYDAIKTMGIKLNGRINTEGLLLRAVR